MDLFTHHSNRSCAANSSRVALIQLMLLFTNYLEIENMSLTLQQPASWFTNERQNYPSE
jgi:hypothetical protein